MLQLLPLYPAFLQAASGLYETAFPEVERRPTEQWTGLMTGNKLFHAEAVCHEGAFCGLLTWWDFDSFIYIEHFAICPDLRSAGLGGRAFGHFMELHADKPIVLEVEPPTEETARRRIGFYQRHGMNLIPGNYRQPSYRPGGESIPLCIMCSWPDFAQTHFDRLTAVVHREVYGVEQEKLV